MLLPREENEIPGLKASQNLEILLNFYHLLRRNELMRPSMRQLGKKIMRMTVAK